MMNLLFFLYLLAVASSVLWYSLSTLSEVRRTRDRLKELKKDDH